MSVEKRYPLLLYREWMRPLQLPTFLLAASLALLWILSLTGLVPISAPKGWPAPEAILGLGAGAALLVWLTLALLPRTAYVDCKPDYLLIRIGLLRMVVSYSRVRTSRTVQHGQIHPPASQPGRRQALAVRMALKQSIALELTSYPIAFFLLRTLAHPFFFLGTEPGFLFAVDDWMGLGREIDQARSAWLARRKDAGRKPRLGGLLEG